MWSAHIRNSHHLSTKLLHVFQTAKKEIQTDRITRNLQTAAISKPSQPIVNDIYLGASSGKSSSTNEQKAAAQQRSGVSIRRVRKAATEIKNVYIERSVPPQISNGCQNSNISFTSVLFLERGGGDVRWSGAKFSLLFIAVGRRRFKYSFWREPTTSTLRLCVWPMTTVVLVRVQWLHG